MAKRKIDNLSSTATASEMEQAIKEAEQTNLPEAVVEETIEVPKEEVQEEVKVEEPKVEEVKPEAQPKEVVDEFGGDYEKVKKSYKEAYAWNTRMAQDLSSIKRELEAIKASAQPKQPDPVITQEQFNEWHDRDPISANRWLAKLEAEESTKGLQNELYNVKASLNGIVAQNTVNAFRSRYSDFTNYENDMKEEINKLPTEVVENPNYYSQVLETAYWTVKGRKSTEEVQRAKEEGRKEALVKTQTKKDAFVEGSTKTTVEQPLNINKMTSSELFEFMKAKGLVNT